MKKCVIIYNPNSGRGLKKITFQKIENILKKYNYEYRFIQSEYSSHIEKIVENLEKVDVVFSIGGDGTFNEAMSGNAKRKTPLVLGHIPTGTTNDIGYMLGLTKSITKNLEMLLKGYIRWIDTCYLNNKLFTYAAGIGYAAYIVEGIKDLLGEELYPYNITYEIDGKIKKAECSFLLVSNSNRIAGIKKLHHNIKLNDQKFEVIICTINQKNELIKKMMKIPTVKEVSKIPGILSYRTNEIKITFENSDKKTFTIDGESYFENNNYFDIKIDKSLPILVPKTTNENIFVQAKIEDDKHELQ